MPTFRSITLSLHSQFDIAPFPEYHPRPQEYYSERGVVSNAPPFIDHKTSTCSVYVQAYPGSQFWIGYSVSRPVPDGQLFVFKLFINGTHIVTWSTGQEQRWRGKTMFGLYEREDDEGKKRVEKRVLCFAASNKDGQWTDVADAFDETAFMEIRVHRAHDRKRVERQIQRYEKTEHGKSGRGIQLVNAGRAGSEMPKRFYKFALIDPTDHPFASFRYYYRTGDQIRHLNLTIEGEAASANGTELSIIEPYCGMDKVSLSTDESDGIVEGDPEDVFVSTGEGCTGLEPRAYVPTGAPGARASIDHAYRQKIELRGDDEAVPAPTYRLSVPPSCRLDPPRPPSRPLPPVPQKHDAASDETSYRPHPAYPVDEWNIRTPSPVKSIREGISTPPLGRRSGLLPTSLMNVIATTWKRRGTPNAELSSDSGSGTASRIVSGCVSHGE